MLTYEEIVDRIQQLSLAERLSLLVVLLRSIEAEMHPQQTRDASLMQVRGIVAIGDKPPSGDEIDTAYSDYLIRKYR